MVALRSEDIAVVDLLRVASGDHCMAMSEGKAVEAEPPELSRSADAALLCMVSRGKESDKRQRLGFRS